MKNIKPSEKLIVAIDYSPEKCGSAEDAYKDAMNLCKKIAGSGVIVKFNSLLRYKGSEHLIKKVHDMGLGVFADLKLTDISNTLKFDGQFLYEEAPELLTVMCSSGAENMQALKNAVDKQTEILGVTVLTSLSHEECINIYGREPSVITRKFAKLAEDANIDGIISSAQELHIFPENFHLSKNCPGIRPEWTLVEGDDQSRIMTPKEAIINGADRLVIGRPITQNDDPIEAIYRTIAEIEFAMSLKKTQN